MPDIEGFDAEKNDLSGVALSTVHDVFAVAAELRMVSGRREFYKTLVNKRGDTSYSEIAGLVGSRKTTLYFQKRNPLAWLLGGFVTVWMIVTPMPSNSQAIPLTPPSTTIIVCPGAFPTDLTATDCRYTIKDRAIGYVSGSITDEAVLGALVFGLGAQIIQSPSEWKRTWDGYGRRVGARYTQAVGKGTAQFLVGWAFQDDPRFLAYRDDPAVIERRRSQVFENSQSLSTWRDPLTHDGWQRFGHAWWDVVTVRRSSIDGNGRRIPALSRFAGEFGGAYAGYPWYPAAENTFPQVGERAAGAFGTAALSSFYTEYKPEITTLLGRILHRTLQPQTAPGGNP